MWKLFSKFSAKDWLQTNKVTLSSHVICGLKRTQRLVLVLIDLIWKQPAKTNWKLKMYQLCAWISNRTINYLKNIAKFNYFEFVQIWYTNIPHHIPGPTADNIERRIKVTIWGKRNHMSFINIKVWEVKNCLTVQIVFALI